MSSPASHPLDQGLRHLAYDRKQKSLGLLCSNFVSLYNRDGVQSIGLDNAASRLGVERRRIYDIVNILESVGVLAKKGKNAYYWIGFSTMPKVLERFEEEARGEISRSEGFVSREDSEDDLDESLDQCVDDGDEKQTQTTNSSTPTDANWKARCATVGRREKSLGTLTENFIKLFLTSNCDTISLDGAAKLLLGASDDASYMRTKVRRLYDIANVLSSINLIEKSELEIVLEEPNLGFEDPMRFILNLQKSNSLIDPAIQLESRKPAFRWLGTKGKMMESNICNVAVQSCSKKLKKRAFGTEITNVDSKRSRLNPVVDKKLVKVEMPSEDLENCNRIKQLQLRSKNVYSFGPFHPIGMMKVGPEMMKCVNEVKEWESMAASFRPLYRNQALSELFAHYTEAWKTWYAEATKGSKSLHQNNSKLVINESS